MKNIFLFTCLVLTSVVFAQHEIYTPTGGVGQTVPGNNNVGVGTEEPEGKLDVKAEGNEEGVRIQTVEDGNAIGPSYAIKVESTINTLDPPDPDPDQPESGGGGSQYSTSTTALLKPSGDLLLGNFSGVSNPAGFLNLRAKGMYVYKNSDNYLKIDYVGGAGITWDGSGQSANNQNFFFSNGTTKLLNIAPNGKVGIGTDEFNGDFKLYVNGKALCEELTVKLKEDWPDYVFEEGYEVMSAEDLREYLAKNKHLPGVPSAEEVQENGVKVGEMNAVLLKQLEELTLRYLELEERMKALQEELAKKQN